MRTALSAIKLRKTTDYFQDRHERQTGLPLLATRRYRRALVQGLVVLIERRVASFAIASVQPRALKGLRHLNIIAPSSRRQLQLTKKLLGTA